jgi:hypothetical protein
MVFIASDCRIRRTLQPTDEELPVAIIEATPNPDSEGERDHANLPSQAEKESKPTPEAARISPITAEPYKITPDAEPDWFFPCDRNDIS